MTTTTIYLSPDKIIYEPKHHSNMLNITRDIYSDQFNTIIGQKRSFLVYQNNNLLGFCLAEGFGMEIIRNLIANKIEKTKTYQIVVKHIEKENMYKIYLYEIQAGYVYNSYPLIEKYRLVEIPRIELKNN